MPDGRCCCYCGALLFEQESVVAAGTTERCGKNCCMQGCAFRRGARTCGWLFLLWLRRQLSLGTATSRIRWVQREQTQLLRPTCLTLAGLRGWHLYCVVYACKTFLRVRNGDAWQVGRACWVGAGLDETTTWQRGKMDESDALRSCGDWLEGGQRSVAAFVRERQTRGRCDLHLDARAFT